MFFSVQFLSSEIAAKSPDEARGWASTHLPLPKEAFNRDATGILRQNVSMFTVLPRKGEGVEVIGIGEDAVTSLARVLPACIQVFGSQYQSGTTKTQAGTVGITLKPYLKSYTAISLCLQASGNSRRQLHRQISNGEIGETELCSLAGETLRKGIHARADMLGLEIPEEAVWGDFSIESAKPVRAGGHPKLCVHLNFRCNLDFHGPWFVGPLASKGCGRIRNSLKGDVS